MKVGDELKSEAFYELIDVIKDKDSDVKFVDFIKRYTLEDILFAFKGNGFGVNAYPGSKSNNKYYNILRNVYSKALLQNKEHMVDEYDQDVKK